MGLRFRKSISLGKFLRLNLSKSGVSVGVGPRGLNVNLGPRGVRETVGLPGTGLYYQETHQWPKSSEAVPVTISGAERSSGFGWKIIGIVIVLIAIVVHFGGRSPATNVKNPTTITKSATTPQTMPQVNPPNFDRPLNREEVLELQTLLRKQGFNAGTSDGVIGPKTRAAAQGFARAHQMKYAVDGPSFRLLEAARGH